MTTRSTKSLLTLAAAAVALSMATAMPAQARGGSVITSPMVKFQQMVSAKQAAKQLAERAAKQAAK